MATTRFDIARVVERERHGNSGLTAAAAAAAWPGTSRQARAQAARRYDPHAVPRRLPASIS